MIASQEEALYEFLDNATGAFHLDDAVSYIRKIEPKKLNRLSMEVEAFINSRNLAFKSGIKRWMSRRGYFQQLPFVISPTRLELLNGILIPGHRCVPFANPGLLPQEYSFFWQGSQVPFTTTEGPPGEFYPYYSVFGEEYAPQYIARDNSENEDAFNSDPYDDPPEVSIKTLDMRNIYREALFVPGDRFVAKTQDWKQGKFGLEKVSKDEWADGDLQAWLLAAEEGFEASFSELGPASCTEEQVAYAYWYGERRMRELPAYSIEDYLYTKTNRIETTAYGIETRFWYAGREIPDKKELDMGGARPDKTVVEEILTRLKIPASEFVIQAYIRDSLYREGGDEGQVIARIVPASVEIENRDMGFLSDYVSNVMEEFREFYNPFSDKATGPIRQRAGELHTAVIDLASRLGKGDIDTSWLPRHTFIILSQIQNHTAAVLEDLDSDETLFDAELEALDNSLDSMIETYEDMKELIDEALGSFRRNKLAVVRSGDAHETFTERLLQLSIGGTDVWRRVIVDDGCTLAELHWIIQTIFGCKNSQAFEFSDEEVFDLDTEIGELEAENTVELLYCYGAKWTVKVVILSRQEVPAKRPVRCVAGSGAAPPEFIGGPVKFKRVLSALECGNDMERHTARRELGPDFDPGEFDLKACNRILSAGVPPKRG